MKKVIIVLTLLAVLSPVILFADEMESTYYATSADYDSSLSHWYNSYYNMDTHAGFDYGACGGGDCNKADYRLVYDPGEDINCVRSYVKDPDGNLDYSSCVNESSSGSWAQASIGALYGTDYHKFEIDY